MKVYILTEVVDYEGTTILGVFDSEEKAIAFSPGNWENHGKGWYKIINSGMSEEIDDYEVK